MAREIVVELPRTAYYTGEVIEGTVVVEASRDVSSRGLYVDFTGTEETVITANRGRSRAPTARARPWSSGVCRCGGRGSCRRARSDSLSGSRFRFTALPRTRDATRR